MHAMDHDVPGHIAPDDTSFLHPGSDLDYTKYIFEKFSLRVRNDQLRFYGHPTQEEEEWKQSTWPLQKQHDHMRLDRHEKLAHFGWGWFLLSQNVPWEPTFPSILGVITHILGV